MCVWRKNHHLKISLSRAHKIHRHREIYTFRKRTASPMCLSFPLDLTDFSLCLFRFYNSIFQLCSQPQTSSPYILSRKNYAQGLSSLSISLALSLSVWYWLVCDWFEVFTQNKTRWRIPLHFWLTNFPQFTVLLSIGEMVHICKKCCSARLEGEKTLKRLVFRFLCVSTKFSRWIYGELISVLN